MINNLTEAQALKMNEIESLKLPRVWREIARVTGPDLFMVIWRIVSTPELNDSPNKIYIPSIQKFYEYQRLQIIKSLISKNTTIEDIITELNKHGMNTSADTIRRIAKKYNLGDVTLR